ncbi:MAG: outer membrane beta-barrel protein [Pirellulales bacterium]
MRLALPTLLLTACAALAAPRPARAQGLLVGDPTAIQAAAHQDSLGRGTTFLINRGAPVRTAQLNDGTFDQHSAEDLGAGQVFGEEPDLTTQVSPDNDTLPGDWIGPNPNQPGMALTAGEEEPQQHSHWLVSWLGMDYWGKPLAEEPRFTGRGRPLLRGSWMNRPWSISWYFGGMFAQGLVPGEVNQGSGGFGGVRLGWDFDPYMGAEMRLGQAKPSIDYPVPSVLVRDNSRAVVWDFSFLYYPWGDAKWRPYGLLGLGLAQFEYHDQNDRLFNQLLLGLPWGVGLKYRWDDRLAIRVELLDNVAFGAPGGLTTMNNISVTGGAEFRFGGARKSYWPWNPSRHLTY